MPGVSTYFIVGGRGNKSVLYFVDDIILSV
jgi:hypothetical protein